MTHRDTQQTIFSYLLSLHLLWAIPAPSPPPSHVGNSNKKVTGMLVVRVRGVNFGFSASLSVLWVKHLLYFQPSLNRKTRQGLHGIYRGLNKLSLSHTPRLVSFRGSVQNFRYHSVCFIWESPFLRPSVQSSKHCTFNVPRLFTVPYFFVRSPGLNAYQYRRESWFHMSRGGGSRGLQRSGEGDIFLASSPTDLTLIQDFRL